MRYKFFVLFIILELTLISRIFPILHISAVQAKEEALTNSFNSPLLLLKKGRQYLDIGRFQEALKIFQEYCSLKPEDSNGYFWTGITYNELNMYGESVQAFRQALQKAERKGMDSAEIRLNLANSLLQEGKEDCLEEYRIALKIDPTMTLAHLNLARALITFSKPEEALQELSICKEMRFNRPQLLYYQIKTLLALNKKEEAKLLLQKLIAELPPGIHKIRVENEFVELSRDDFRVAGPPEDEKVP